jgi:hypothetical protein
MRKKEEKDMIYDPNIISSFNINTKNAKTTSKTWNQNLFVLQKPEADERTNSTIKLIYSSLTKLKNNEKYFYKREFILDTEKAKHDSNPAKVLYKEDGFKNLGENFKEIDLKVTKKAEESKKMLEISNMLSLKTKKKIEELEDKVAKLKLELTKPLSRRKSTSSQKSFGFTNPNKNLFPSIYK